MRLQQYINEAKIKVDHGKIVNDLVRDSKQFLKDVGFDRQLISLTLFSGRASESPLTPYIQKKVRTNRKPKDTPDDLHKTLDGKFQKKFGVKVRSSGLFCTGRVALAAAYGHPFAVFPKGKYKVIWSPDVTDLWLQLVKIYSDVFGVEENADIMKYSYKNIAMISPKWRYKGLSPDVAVSYIKDELDNRLDQIINTYNEGDISNAIVSGNEVVLICNEYHGVSARGYAFRPIANFFYQYGIVTVEEAAKSQGTYRFESFMKSKGFLTNIGY